MTDLASESVRLALKDLHGDVSSLHLLQYAGKVDGYLVTAKNSGTHGLRFMLSAAIAHHLGLPAPVHSSGPESNDYIGHPRNGWAHDQAPRIGSSHNIPSRLLSVPGVVGLPPTVILVRDIRQALLSYYVKWVERYELGSIADYVRRPAPDGKRVNDVWWFIRFFNRWGEMQARQPGNILVVRQEDLKADPGEWVRRVWAHWGVTLTPADIAAAVAVSDREVMARKLDPKSREVIVPDRARREAAVLSADDEAYLSELFGKYLKHDFGYGLIAPAGRH